jgi:hypothetical protein
MFLGGLRESCGGKEKDSGDQTFHGPQSPVEPRRVQLPCVADGSRVLVSASRRNRLFLCVIAFCVWNVKESSRSRGRARQHPRRVRYPDARDRALLSSSAKSVTLLLMKVRRAFAFALATPRLTHRVL